MPTLSIDVRDAAGFDLRTRGPVKARLVPSAKAYFGTGTTLYVNEVEVDVIDGLAEITSPVKTSETGGVEFELRLEYADPRNSKRGWWFASGWFPFEDDCDLKDVASIATPQPMPITTLEAKIDEAADNVRADTEDAAVAALASQTAAAGSATAAASSETNAASSETAAADSASDAAASAAAAAASAAPAVSLIQSTVTTDIGTPGSDIGDALNGALEEAAPDIIGVFLDGIQGDVSQLQSDTAALQGDVATKVDADGASTIAVGQVATARNRLATRAGYDTARSNGYAVAAAATVARFTEAWADLTQWAVTSSSVQVSGGKLYGVSGGGGANHSWRVAPGVLARAVFKVNLLTGGTAGQGVFVGINRDTVGAAPSAGGAHSRGLYFKPADGTVVSLDDGVQDATPVFSGLGSSTWVVTVTVDENYVSISATASSGSAPRVYTRWTRDDAAHPINNLSIMVNDSRALTGSSVEAITEAAIGGLSTGNTITGGVGAHWGSDNGDNFLILTPTTYDSRKPNPAVIVFHGNGSDETHWTTNSNGKAIADAFLANGYIVIAAANTGGTSTWASNPGIDAYTHAYQYARDHYNVGALVFYANSMGGVESLNVLARDVIPGVAAWAASVPTFDLDENHANVLFTATIDSAYGGNYAVNGAGHNPATFNPLTFRGIPMLMMLATDDASVTPSANGYALYSAIAATNARTKIEVTGGHSTAEIANQAQAFVTHCNSALGLRNSWPA